MLNRDEICAIYTAGSEAVVQLVEALLTTQTELRQQVATLTTRVAELEARLNKDSHNSHKPPSSDGLGKKPHPHSLRKRTGKKSGGQIGHPGVTLTLVDDPTDYQVWAPLVCSACGAPLAKADIVARERRQVIDVPAPKLEIVEHQVLHKACPQCQAVTAGSFPPDVSQPVQYGPHVKAAAVYLQVGQFLSYERTSETLRDLFGVMPSEGTLTTAQATAYTCLEPIETAIVAKLKEQRVLTVDETGVRVMQTLHWIHVAGTDTLTYYAHHAKRGLVAIQAIGVLIGFGGRRVHDAMAAYLKLPGLYALCNAHLLRELTALVEDTGQAWAASLIRLLVSLKDAVAEARATGQTELPTRQRAGYEAAYTRLIQAGEQANPPPRRRDGAAAPNKHRHAICSTA